MPEQIKKFADPLKARWDIMTQKQRYKLFAIIAGILFFLILFAYFAFSTKWITLVNREDWRTVTGMQNSLNDAGIKNRVRAGGTELRVDKLRVDEARGVIELSDSIPNSEHFTWGDALDSPLGTTDDERRIKEVLAKEGQIARQLITINGISGAIVTLSIPSTRPFDRNPPQPTASVVLTVTGDFQLSQGRDIAMLIARNVSRLEIDNIFVIDQYARSVWNGLDDVSSDTFSNTHQMREQHRNQALVGLHQIFTPNFNEVVATFTPNYDDTLLTERIREIYEIPEGMEGTGIPHLTISSNSSMEGGTAADEPGLQPNTATFPNYVNPSNNEMSATQRENESHFSINTTKEVVQSGPGWVIPDTSYATVNAVDYVNVRQEIWMAQGEEGEIRTQADWEQFKDDNTRPVIINETFSEYDTYHRLAALAVGLPMDNVHLVISQKIIPHDTIVKNWDIPTIIVVAVLGLLMVMLLLGLFRKQKIAGEEEEALEPQLAVEDLLVSTQLEEAKEEAAQELEEIDYFKENEIKKHIEKFVNEKPEAVAALLRNWINVEEW